PVYCVVFIHLSFFLSPSYFLCFLFFFFNDPAPTEIYTLSLHDALPISTEPWKSSWVRRASPYFFFSSPRSSLISIMIFASCCRRDRKSTRLNSSHVAISYAVFCLKKKKKKKNRN